MKFSKRMDLFGESIFTTLANMRSERKKQGLEVIDLSIGAPNIPPTQEVMETIAKEAMKPENYLYIWRFRRLYIRHHLEQPDVSRLFASLHGYYGR